MKLLVISHTPHYRAPNGELQGWAPTVRELDHLAPLFSRVVHLAPLYDGDPPASSAPYGTANVELSPLRPTGGDGLAAKWGILRYGPTLWRRIDAAYRAADVVHVRAPANIAATALLYLDTRRDPKPSWVKYAGNWRPEAHTDYPAYRFQRRRLQRPRPRRIVTVNGRWPGDGEHIRPFLNPCLSDDEWSAARRAAAGKFYGDPLRLLFVGRLDEQKGALRAVRITRRLQGLGLAVELTVAGDGPEAPAIEAAAQGGDGIRWVGWQSRAEIDRLYGAAHLLLLPSVSEGWPKVLSEAMAHGALPVAGDVSAIGQILRELQPGPEPVGWVLPARDEDAFVDLIQAVWEKPKRLAAGAQVASQAAGAFTYGVHVERVRSLYRRLGVTLG